MKDYTERQKLIITGCIPYEEFSAADCTRILRIAREKGDRQVINAIENLLFDKQEDAREARNENALKNYYKNKEAILEKAHEKYIESLGDNLELTKREMKLIDMTGDVSEYSIKELNFLKRKVTKMGNERYIHIVDMQIELKNNPYMFYPTRDEAISILKSLPRCPIKLMSEIQYS